MEPGKFYSQLDLPFQETNPIFLSDIFLTLERKFDLKKDSNQAFVDLGSGNGQIIIYSAINYGILSTGVEIDPILIKEAENSVKDLKKHNEFRKNRFKKIRMIQGDFYQHNLKNYDYIYIYSLPTMQKYLKHVFKTAKNGSIIISHIYPIKNLSKYLELKLKLELDSDNKKVYTFFYLKI